MALSKQNIPLVLGTVMKVITAGLLFGALVRQHRDYYTLLRWIVCGVSAFTAFRAFQINKIGWLWTFAIVAAAFNPFVPLYLKRNTWAFIDVGVAALLLISIVTVDRHARRQ